MRTFPFPTHYKTTAQSIATIYYFYHIDSGDRSSMFAQSLIRKKVLSISLLAFLVLQSQLHKPKEDQPSNALGTPLRNKSISKEKLSKGEKKIVPVSRTEMVKNETSQADKATHVVMHKSTAKKPRQKRKVDSKFDPRDLDISNQVLCGWHKCYYPSKCDPDNVGYLIARSVSRSAKRRRAMLKSLDAAWKFAKHLEKKHKIHHFLLAPPISIKVNKRLESRLNRKVTSETTNHHFHGKRFHNGMPAFVEKVQPAPKGTLLIGCKDSKLELLEELVDKFAARIDDKEAFLKRFQKSLVKVRDVLYDEPCLLLDFQVLCDTQGTFYHLDFDRCFSEKTTKKKIGRRPDRVASSPCYQSLDDIERRVIRAVQATDLGTHVDHDAIESSYR